MGSCGGLFFLPSQKLLPVRLFLRRAQSFGEVCVEASWVLRCSPGSLLCGWFLRRGQFAASSEIRVWKSVKKRKKKEKKKKAGDKKRGGGEKKKIIRMKPTPSAALSLYFHHPPLVKLPNEADVAMQ